MSPKEQDESAIQRYVSTGEGAVAKAFVKDVLELKDAGVADWDIWYLGSVPCRKVTIVGILVGVIEYEKKALFTVDDGTGVMDCIYQRAFVVPKPTTSNRTYKGKERALLPYYDTGPEIPIGATVSITGKVVKWKEGTRLTVEDISQCPSSREPVHWLEVSELHRTKYSKPFVVPPSTPKTNRTIDQHSYPSAANSSPYRLSPTKADAGSLVLRHPSKISSSQLTTHTFRIHVAQFLDHASRPLPPSSSSARAPDFDPFYMDTPTHRRPTSPSTTPRSKPRTKRKPETKLEGFSLSYLRRVPEIDCLGRRVVMAEAKRRAKEAKAKEKAKETKLRETQAGSSRAKSSSSSSRVAKVSSERTSLKVKRLLLMTLRTLREDGVIMLVDGPGRKWADSVDDERARRACWREPAPSDSHPASSPSKTLPDSSLYDDPPSSPETHTTNIEECFLPITPATIADPVLAMMRKVIGPCGGMRGVSPQEILKKLQVTDEKWGRMLEDQVLEALRCLEGQKVVWNVGEGRWGLVE